MEGRHPEDLGQPHVLTMKGEKPWGPAAALEVTRP